MLAVALLIIYAAFVSGSGGYCSAREFFSGRHDEEDDACIAKLIKRADDGNSFAESRLRYPTMEYIKEALYKIANFPSVRFYEDLQTPHFQALVPCQQALITHPEGDKAYEVQSFFWERYIWTVVIPLFPEGEECSK